MTPVTSVEQAIEQFYVALNRLINGDSGAMKAILSHRDDATAFLGWGGYERGWAQLEPRWEWAKAQFAGGQVTAETISLVVADNLAYTVALEHGLVRLVGRDAPAETTLRITHIYRREEAGWKLVHRHADQLTPQREPAP